MKKFIFWFYMNAKIYASFIIRPPHPKNCRPHHCVVCIIFLSILISNTKNVSQQYFCTAIYHNSRKTINNNYTMLFRECTERKILSIFIFIIENCRSGTLEESESESFHAGDKKLCAVLVLRSRLFTGVLFKISATL